MNKKILIADDDKVVLKLIESYLTPSGFDVMTATDGLEALMKIKEEIPDLVILDIVLPEINGYDICYQLRFNEEFMHIPILLVTERADELGETIGERVNLRHVRKPVDKDTLLTQVNELLGIQSS